MSSIEKALNEMKIGLLLIQTGNKKVEQASQELQRLHAPVKEKKGSLTPEQISDLFKTKN